VLLILVSFQQAPPTRRRRSTHRQAEEVRVLLFQSPSHCTFPKKREGTTTKFHSHRVVIPIHSPPTTIYIYTTTVTTMLAVQQQVSKSTLLRCYTNAASAVATTTTRNNISAGPRCGTLHHRHFMSSMTVASPAEENHFALILGKPGGGKGTISGKILKVRFASLRCCC
jgi:hypothetical protein